ncbi:MAG: LytR C-terminal domain-containing protein [Fibrobacter sp.]|jgi:hypothetical protein|nr:LytR C-terminal domain-containing protein [Fibrobacter sp.]
MSNLFTLIIVSAILGISMFIGTELKTRPVPRQEKKKTVSIPYIGRIEVLNGCGIEGAAGKVADYLRSTNFDIKSVGNAQTWNYPFTIVISRTQDTTVASQVASSLDTDKMIIIRNNDKMHDVTVIIGPDFGERIQ